MVRVPGCIEALSAGERGAGGAGAGIDLHGSTGRRDVRAPTIGMDIVLPTRPDRGSMAARRYSPPSGGLAGAEIHRPVLSFRRQRRLPIPYSIDTCSIRIFRLIVLTSPLPRNSQGGGQIVEGGDIHALQHDLKADRKGRLQFSHRGLSNFVGEEDL